MLFQIYKTFFLTFLFLAMQRKPMGPKTTVDPIHFKCMEEKLRHFWYTLFRYKGVPFERVPPR